jgi:acetyl/propionyl-CoA carboxylase alpha subunit
MSHDISRDTFERADADTKSMLMFDLMNRIYDKVHENQCLYTDHLGKCEDRFKKLEARKKIDTAVATGSGIFGGFVAMLTKLAIWGKG